MKLVMTLLVRDEEDILKENIEFHLDQGVDFIIAMDNISQDTTVDILKFYEKKNILKLIHQPSDDYNQGEWVTYMAELACKKYDANFIINSDADEFWIPCNKKYKLKDIIKNIDKETSVLECQRTNFLPPEIEDERHFIDSMQVREKQSFNSLGNPLPPKVCHRANKNIKVSQGNHAVWLNGEKVLGHKNVVEVLHFPLRSYDQFKNKISKGGAAYERNQILDKNVGKTWRELYKKLMDGQLESYYRSQIVSEEEVVKGLCSGKYIKDMTLKNFFR